MSTCAPLLDLPPELLLLTADHLSTRDLSALSRVCHCLHSSLTFPLARRFATEATSILIWAVASKNLTIVKRALADGADPDGDDNECPLHIATAQCSIEIVTVLIEAGAEVDKRVRAPKYSGDYMEFECDGAGGLLEMCSAEMAAANEFLEDDSGFGDEC